MSTGSAGRLGGEGAGGSGEGGGNDAEAEAEAAEDDEDEDETDDACEPVTIGLTPLGRSWRSLAIFSDTVWLLWQENLQLEVSSSIRVTSS